MAGGFKVECFREEQPMLTILARKQIGPANAIEDRRNFDQHIIRIAVGLLQIA